MKCIIEYDGKKYYGCIVSHNGANDLWIILYTDKARNKKYMEFNLSMLEFNFYVNKLHILGFVRNNDGLYEAKHFEVTRMV